LVIRAHSGKTAERQQKLLMLCVIKDWRAAEKARAAAIEKKYEERRLAAMEKNRGEGLKKSRSHGVRQAVSAPRLR
jgi:hypothetical protein